MRKASRSREGLQLLPLPLIRNGRYLGVNLLTAPLFGLFFMALFVPWATRFGTLVGGAFGIATVRLEMRSQ